METNDKYISIPSYLSTSWKNIRSLHMKEGQLIVTLIDGSSVSIPELKQPTIDQLFACHASFLNHQGQRSIVETTRQKETFIPRSGEVFDPQIIPSMRFTLGTIEQFGAVMQHNPAQADAPDLPPEVLQKIVAVTKIVAPNDSNLLPRAEPHCNCIHCQIAKAMHGEPEPLPSLSEEREEPVDNKELSFKDWDIAKKGENLYTLTNPLDLNEQYTVFLGEPVGCTCGKSHCEHIVAVLRS